MSTEVVDAMCKRILKHVVDLVGVEFLDEEIKYWKGVEGMKGEGCEKKKYERKEVAEGDRCEAISKKNGKRCSHRAVDGHVCRKHKTE
jgi:hypothetical protein